MNETISTIGIIAQLGIGGVLLVAVYVIWSKANEWIEAQQQRDDARWGEVRDHDQEFMIQLMDASREQSKIHQQTAEIMQATVLELKVVVAQLNMATMNGRGD